MTTNHTVENTAFLDTFQNSGLDDEDSACDHHGQPFTVIKRLPDGYEGRRMWSIRFNDGTELEAFDVEVERNEWAVFNE